MAIDGLTALEELRSAERRRGLTPGDQLQL
jgi:hypothetical protein